MVHDEQRVRSRHGAASLLPLLFCHLLLAALFLLPVTLRAEPDKDMSGLLGKLEEFFSTNSVNTVATNEKSLLAPPLPEIPPTLWERYGWVVWLILPFVVMMVGIVAALLLRPRKPPVLYSPAAEARFAFAALQAQPEDGAMLSQISRTLRRYLIAAFWLDSSETTTAEFCIALKANAQVGPELSGAISEFLKHCDERKFSPAAGAARFAAASRAAELVDQAEVQRAKRQRAGALQDTGASAVPPNA